MQRLTGLIQFSRRQPIIAGGAGCLVLVVAFFACGFIQIALNPSLLNTRTPTATVPSPTVTITHTPTATVPSSTPEPTRTPRPSKTPTPTASPRPTRTATPTLAPTVAGSAPRNFDANGDGKVTCADFTLQSQAQEAYNAGYTDLDGAPKDGKACESLP